MLEPCFPENEAERLSVLNSLNVLDSNSVEKLDRITRLAAKYFGVTIALVSLIDRDRQWFYRAMAWMRGKRRAISRFAAMPSCSVKRWWCPTLPGSALFDNPLVVGGPRIGFMSGSRCYRWTACRSARFALSTATLILFLRTNWPTCMTSPR